MAFIRIPNTVMVEVVILGDGQFMENVFHCSNAVSYDESDIANLLDVFRTWWDSDMKPSLPTTLSLVNLIGTDMDAADGPRVEDTTGLPIVGIAGSVALPYNVSLAVKWQTAKRGRSFRGRTYFIGLTEGVVTDNSVSPASIAAITTIFANLLVDVAAAGWTMVVASKYTNNAPRAVAITTPITGVSVDSTVDSQRRRLPGRGS